MRPFNLDHLRSFVTVVEAGSISAAAPRLNLSSSAVSEQLSKLEDFTGQSLLLRGKKGVTPTPSGERLGVFAREMLVLSARALDEVRGVSFSGELRLAITDYFRPNEIPPMLVKLRERYPDLRLNVRVQKSVDIRAQRDEDPFDIGLSMQILSPAHAHEGTQVCREPLHWVAAEGFNWDPARPLSLLALPAGCAMQGFTRQLLEENGVSFAITHSASGVAGLQSALLAGLGVACLNASSIPSGLKPWRDATRLPALPDVSFVLLPPRDGEKPLVSDVRQRLLQHWTMQQADDFAIGSQIFT
ncbi:LysR family transcriptional regulator [Rouxiella badensis]|jgi:DNA-binding transcriptional LysR family regulator|uniref:LysR family transcriptional regulator n=2 Tax=Rouxiella badensis TaxID=1646377 RepID=UPI0004ACAA21|nr:LysR family transcriptional regulator [Rouxiella badensis]MCC3735558.1 LysR family transcriptional regulator [Rouxiella badensis]MCC3760855.1 LysR family transcriptional regulator [Rouxiella badensis]QII36960.1 LysR family transcriptional regulator [Rouxiella badensis]WAT09504.1 LysR family transcriptional regulator [Rouxiella badensis]